MQAGKTIAAKRERATPDSERERARRVIRKRKVLAVFFVVAFGATLVYLGVKAFTEWIKWISVKEEVIVVAKEPSVEVIDERTGKRAEKMSTVVREFIADLEEEFAVVGLKITQVRIPVDKLREVDVEIQGFSGVIKVSTDRGAAVSAEDALRMIEYLKREGVESCEYVDVRIERKAYWR